MTVRLSFAPVDRLLEGQSDTIAGELLAVTRRTIIRYRKEGLTPPLADKIATRLGHHPARLWPDYDHAEDCWLVEAHWPRGRAIPAGLVGIPFWPEPEPDGRFCGRHPEARAGRPHTCATDGCCSRKAAA